ncbi:DUF427 domain-containing protein [Cytophagaceae bacterium ABcell3]|nr:DUF427 domain-containing protein [Cytophagaceae bacterium ABcell3]
MVIAEWNGKIIAKSKQVLEIDGYTYFPLSALKSKYFEESKCRGRCPDKGIAHYLHLHVNGEVNENAAWFYPDPLEKAWMLKGMVSFWKGVKVEKTAGYDNVYWPKFLKQYFN